MGVVTSRDPFSTLIPPKIYAADKARDFKFGVHVDQHKSQPTEDKLSLKGAWSVSRDLIHLMKISE